MEYRLKYAPNSGMSLFSSILRTPTRRIAGIALLIIGLDQLTKQIVLRSLGIGNVESAMLAHPVKLLLIDTDFDAVKR